MWRSVIYATERRAQADRSLIESIQYPSPSSHSHLSLPYDSTLGIGVKVAAFYSDGAVPRIYNYDI